MAEDGVEVGWVMKKKEMDGNYSQTRKIKTRQQCTTHPPFLSLQHLRQFSNSIT